MFRRYATPTLPCGMPYLVPMRIWMLIRACIPMVMTN